MRIAADLELCIAAGMCAMTAPDVFDQDPTDGRVVVRAERPDPARLDVVREAVEICPSGALALVDDCGNER